MDMKKKKNTLSLVGLVVVMLVAVVLAGCAKPNEEPDPNRDPDRYGYIKTRDTENNPNDNAAIRHEKRGHNRWRP